MDWADDITYAVHDAEDFYRAGLVPLDRLKALPAEREEFADWVHKAWGGMWDGKPVSHRDILDAVSIIDTRFGSHRPYGGEREQRIATRSFVSGLVRQYVGATMLEYEGGTYRLDIDPLYRLQVDALKQLTGRYVIERPALASQAQEALDEGDSTPELRGRTACEVICGLTEQEVVRLHARLTGIEAGSIIDPIVRH